MRVASVEAGSPDSRQGQRPRDAAASLVSVMVRGSANTTRYRGASGVWLYVVYMMVACSATTGSSQQFVDRLTMVDVDRDDIGRQKVRGLARPAAAGRNRKSLAGPSPPTHRALARRFATHA